MMIEFILDDYLLLVKKVKIHFQNKQSKFI